MKPRLRFKDDFIFALGCPTVCGSSRVLFTGYWQMCLDKLNNQAGVDSAWEQDAKRLEASLS
jgi:hypothetical protein